MTFVQKRDKLTHLLKSAEINEIFYSKNSLPSALPAAIVTLANRTGTGQVDFCYAEQKYKFEVLLVTDDTENADLLLLDTIEIIDNQMQQALHTAIDTTEFYDSLLNAKSIKIAKFEVLL